MKTDRPDDPDRVRGTDDGTPRLLLAAVLDLVRGAGRDALSDRRREWGDGERSARRHSSAFDVVEPFGGVELRTDDGWNRDALEDWWSQLPAVERHHALQLPEGVPLPEEFVVGLLLSGFRLPHRSPGSSPVEQPEALRHLLDREASRRSPDVDARSRRPHLPLDDDAGVMRRGQGRVRRLLRVVEGITPRRARG